MRPKPPVPRMQLLERWTPESGGGTAAGSVQAAPALSYPTLVVKIEGDEVAGVRELGVGTGQGAGGSHKQWPAGRCQFRSRGRELCSVGPFLPPSPLLLWGRGAERMQGGVLGGAWRGMGRGEGGEWGRGW